ncbi:MAG TPA: ATP-binding protein [Actinomycetota bacterium]|nr:ATP-binding protein [Actinomycetota bacterium]
MEWTPWRPLDLRDDVAPEIRDAELLRTVGTRFGDVFEEAAIGMALVALDGAFLRVNPSLAQGLGRSREDLLRLGLQSVVDPEDLGGLLSRMRLASAGGGRTFQTELRMQHASTGSAWLFLTGALIAEDADRPLCFLLQAHDIGRRKAAEAELQRALEELQATDEAKSRFVAVAAHELRSPLTSVVGFAQTLWRHWDNIPDGEKRQYLSLIVEQGERLSRLVGDLLTVSRLEGGTIRVRPITLDVSKEVGEIIGELPCADEVDIVGEEGLELLGDPDHLRQMLTNLVTNAFKYGAPPVDVEIRDEGDSVELLVRDCGDGVPREFVPALFESFSRADSGTARVAGGTGLGLSIVRGLARAQGGEVWYEPNDPSGACFGLRLPVPTAGTDR